VAGLIVLVMEIIKKVKSRKEGNANNVDERQPTHENESLYDYQRRSIIDYDLDVSIKSHSGSKNDV
jgi:hypothetical protein